MGNDYNKICVPKHPKGWQNFLFTRICPRKTRKTRKLKAKNIAESV